MKQIPIFLTNFTEKLDDDSMLVDLPVDLSTDSITPISRQHIDQVNKLAWIDMTSADLSSQLEILQQRYYTILGMARPDIANQVLMGINDLNKRIKIKIKEETEVTKRRVTGGENDGKS